MSFLLTLLLAGSPTAAHISQLAPGIDDARVRFLARQIDRAASRYDLDPILLASIVHQESGFRPGLQACVIVHRYRQCQVTCDYGLAQINEYWIRHWKLDPEALRYDPGYNLRVAARILANLRREYGHEDNWFGRYHSGTPSVRARYEEKLQARLTAAIY